MVRWLILAIVTVMLLAAVTFLSEGELPSSPPVGKILNIKSNVMVKHTTQEQFLNAVVNEPLWSESQILTTEQGEARFKFAEMFLMEPETHVRLEAIGPKKRIHLLRGRLSRLDKKNIAVEILGSDITEPLAAGPFEVTTSQPAHAITPSSDADSAESENSESATWLKETFSLHQRFIEKCFIQHMERSGSLSPGGRILLDFTVQKDGKMRNIKVAHSSLDDKKLSTCVVEVAKRVRIKKTFEKEQQVTFPIVFQSPATE